MSIDGGLRSTFREKLPRFHFQSIENTIGRGCPDSNYCFDGIEGWIEYKKTSGWKIKLRPEQIGWHLRRSRAGGKTFVAVLRISKKQKQLWIFRGEQSAELKSLGLRGVKPALMEEGEPSRWDWERIAKILLGRL